MWFKRRERGRARDVRYPRTRWNLSCHACDQRVRHAEETQLPLTDDLDPALTKAVGDGRPDTTLTYYRHRTEQGGAPVCEIPGARSLFEASERRSGLPTL